MEHKYVHLHIDGLVQDCSNSTANAVELMQSYTKPSMKYIPWIMHLFLLCLHH